MQPCLRPGLFILMTAGCLQSSASAAIVYDRYTFVTPQGLVFCHDWQTNPIETASNQEVPGGGENFSEVAQRLTLVGTDRFVTQLDMSLWAFAASGSGSGPCVTDVTAYLYAPNGSSPGSLLWSGTITGVSLNPTSSASQGVVPVSFFPNVTVPNVVYLSFSHANISNQRGFMGVTFNSSPGGGPGIAGPWFDRDTTTGLWAPEFGGGGGSIIARLTAVPTPATCPLLGLGLGVLRRRR